MVGGGADAKAGARAQVTGRVDAGARAQVTGRADAGAAEDGAGASC